MEQPCGNNHMQHWWAEDIQKLVKENKIFWMVHLMTSDWI